MSKSKRKTYTAPQLRYRVIDTIESDLSPQQMYREIEHYLPPEFKTTFNHTDDSNITFVLTHPDLDITGTITPHQGTGSRTKFTAQVTTPEKKRNLQQLLVVMPAVFISVVVIYFAGLVDPVELILNWNIYMAIWILLVVASSWLSYNYLWKNRSGGKRWQAQQAMAQILDTVFYPLADSTHHDDQSEEEDNLHLYDYQDNQSSIYNKS